MATTLNIPASIYDHTMDVLKNMDLQHRLDYTTSMADSVTVTPYAGKIVHVDTVGKFQMGCAADKMSLVLWNPSVPYGHQPSVVPLWQSVGGFTRTGLAVSGGYEICTNQYDTSQQYAFNDYLTAPANNTNDVGGRLTNKSTVANAALTYPGRGGGSTVTVCGQVSYPPQTLRDKRTVLSFWTVHFPGSTTWNGLT